MTRSLRVLILEDCPADAELMVRTLHQAGFELDWKRAETEEEMFQSLVMKPDVILADFAMPRFNGLDALRTLRKCGVDIPFIIVSGRTGEEIAVEAMQQGVEDYLLKDRLARLPLAVSNALERKRLRDNERQQAGQLRLRAAAMEAAANTIVITDATGTILWANPAFTRITGYTLGEAIGKNSRLLKSGKHDVAFYEQMWKAIQSGQCWHGEVVNRKKNGELYQEEMTITPVRAEGKDITHFIAVKQDVTARKQLEAQLLQAQKMESFGRLAGGVAHDFNNLLTVICGFSELLLGAPLPKEQATDLITQIKKAGEKAAALTKQLLAFSRKQILQTSVLNLNNVVADIEKMLRRLIGEDIQLVVEPAGDLHRVKADPSQIEQVLINLAVNARDAMPKGGKLTIETRNADNASLPLGVPAGRDGYVELIVSDTGCGMTPEILTRIFEPFFTTKEQGKGTGLGLATVHGIVTQSGGFIDVASAPGKGTTFRVLLPRTQASLSEIHTPPPAAPKPRAKETILLVEDDAAVRALAGMILKDAGYRVLKAEGGKDALELLLHAAEPIQLMLTDVVMPQMSGRELADLAGPKSPHMRVLYMSGYLDDTVVRHGVVENGLSFLQKPFTAGLLLAKVREVLDGTSSASSQPTCSVGMIRPTQTVGDAHPTREGESS